jgi:hypothetical protein
MLLSTDQREAIWSAFIDAFDEESLDNLLFFRLADWNGGRLDRLTSGRNWDAKLLSLIQRAERENRAGRLVAAAREMRPDDPKIADAAAALGLSSAAPARRELQRIIDEHQGLHDPVAWRGRLAQIETQVCRIEISVLGGKVRGTGFLVGPDTVLTNHHVIRRLIGGNVQPGAVSLRFDYKVLADGTTVNAGTEVGLADDWLIASSPPSAVDELVDPGDKLPDPGELDFALLRLACALGDKPIGASAPPGSAKRGWIELADAPNPAPGVPLFIMQHPRGAPVKLAAGPVLELNGNETRLRYRANTEGGSSGSPCFDINLDLVALHHSGDPDNDPAHRPQYNEGIPIGLVAQLSQGGATT